MPSPLEKLSALNTNKTKKEGNTALSSLKELDQKPLDALKEISASTKEVNANNNAELEMKISQSKAWAASGQNFFGAESTYNVLPVGFYIPRISYASGLYLESSPIISDTIVPLPNKTIAQVIANISEFWAKEEEFTKRGLLHKRAALLEGPPGNGKTASVMLIAKSVMDQGGICLQAVEPQALSAAMRLIRRIEPDRPILCVLEEFETLLRKYGEEDFLHLLDGELQINKVAFVATTNYASEIRQRFKNRPSRFDLVVRVDLPDFDERKNYVIQKAQTTCKKLADTIAEDTDGLSLAHIKEIIIAVEILGEKYEDVIQRLLNQQTAYGDQPPSNPKLLKEVAEDNAAVPYPGKLATTKVTRL